VRVNRRKKVTLRIPVRELGMSRTSVLRVLCADLELRAYKVQIKPLLTDEHKEKRIRFSNWIRTSFRKKDRIKVLSSEEKKFDIDVVYNSQMKRYRRQIMPKPISEVVSGRDVNFCKWLWFGSQFVRKESLLRSFSRKAQWIMTSTSNECLHLL
jgi:hypothetical protein